jgi:hypothetical protein
MTEPIMSKNQAEWTELDREISGIFEQWCRDKEAGVHGMSVVKRMANFIEGRDAARDL